MSNTNEIEATMSNGTPMITHLQRLTVGDHPATVNSARLTANHNGKPFVELDVTLHGSSIRRQHQMFVSTPAAANNAARQLNRAFGIESFSKEALASLAGQTCSLRAAEEEYNGRVSVKTVFVNPYHTSDVNIDIAALDAAFTSPPKEELLF